MIHTKRGNEGEAGKRKAVELMPVVLAYDAFHKGKL
jgi:hypothetical protein